MAVFFAAVYLCWINVCSSAQTSTFTPSKYNFFTDDFILVIVYFDNISLLGLQVSLAVNCSCIIAVIIAICLISVDVVHGWPEAGGKIFLPVSPNQPNQTPDSVVKVTETFAINSWSCWNSAC